MLLHGFINPRMVVYIASQKFEVFRTLGDPPKYAPETCNSMHDFLMPAANSVHFKVNYPGHLVQTHHKIHYLDFKFTCMQDINSLISLLYILLVTINDSLFIHFNIS